MIDQSACYKQHRPMSHSNHSQVEATNSTNATFEVSNSTTLSLNSTNAPKEIYVGNCHSRIMMIPGLPLGDFLMFFFCTLCQVVTFSIRFFFKNLSNTNINFCNEKHDLNVESNTTTVFWRKAFLHKSHQGLASWPCWHGLVDCNGNNYRLHLLGSRFVGSHWKETNRPP